MDKEFKLFFISDAHFGSEKEEKEKKKKEKFKNFLELNLKRNDYLFILGDLFDFWFEYRYLIPKDCFQILTILYNLVQRGVKVIFVGGNHDFWENGFFKKELGIEFYRESLTVNLFSKKFYLHHGDGFIKKDKGYLILRSILRNKFNIWLYKLIHPDLSVFLAKYFSNKSRINTQKKKNSLFEEYFKFAHKKFEEGVDYVIMGHTHIPIIEKFGNKYFVNIGDWIENFTYGVYDGEQFKLKKWD
jgi:UDP-2,3-diacylglucosamine hydrolase